MAPEPAEGQVKPGEVRGPQSLAQGTQPHRRPAEHECQSVAPSEASFAILLSPFLAHTGGFREAGSLPAKCTEALGCWQGWLRCLLLGGVMVCRRYSLLAL